MGSPHDNRTPDEDLETSDTRTRLINIQPTSSGGYSDSALTAMLAAQIANINAGKVLIWQRYNMLLAANAVLLGVITKDPPKTERSAWAWMLFGMVLCGAWFIVTVAGWRHNMRYLKIASRFRWDLERLGTRTDPNPVSPMYIPITKQDWSRNGWLRDGVFLGAIIIIAITFLAHLTVYLATWE